jgi:hypothetical protein
MRRKLVIAGLALLTTVGMGQTRAKPKPLSDTALDRVTAGGTGGSASFSAGLNNGVVQFQGQVPTGNGLVAGAGTMSFLNGPINTTNNGSINISDNAQQNLTSLVNITAVNSNISVLLNLNVNINSTVGTLTQSNIKH